MVPGIIGNPYLGGHFPWPKQALFLGAHLEAHTGDDDDPIFECMFGGAAGPGKSDALLMACSQMVFLYPNSSSIILRRTFEELTEPGALLDRAMAWWYGLPGVHWTGKKFMFPNGAQVSFGHHNHQKDDKRYQSAQYQLVCFDELTCWPTDHALMHLRSRIRRDRCAGDVPLRMLCATNPGEQGHIWVKNRYIGGVDQDTGEEIEPVAPFIPGRISDNPSLDQEAYFASLGHLHPTRMKQLRDGDWSAREPGDYFREEWWGPPLDPDEMWLASDCIRIRWWDLAASESDKSAATAGVLMARHVRGVRAIEDCVSFHKTTGERDDRIIETALADGKHVVVGLEIEPGSGGPSQVYYLEKRLKKLGFRVVYARPKPEQGRADKKHVHASKASATGKLGRAVPVSACVYHGHVRRGEAVDQRDDEWGADVGKPVNEQRHGIRVYAGRYLRTYLDKMEGVPNMEPGSQRLLEFDEADATIGAWKWLEAHPAGGQVPGRYDATEPVPAELHDIHPADRPDQHAGDKVAGRWRQ